ncbi:hypothetical protein [uncultured Acinetobacter sp.]|uniref:hypothetical protein n=1 Tax=uncultured Acinetobacter sp. TaxID=165433 RepID=UPI0025D6E85D|nr:hypothetical protein [uncultured Acinetobacter sp.]
MNKTISGTDKRSINFQNFHCHDVKNYQQLFKTDDVLKKATELAQKNLKTLTFLNR